MQQMIFSTPSDCTYTRLILYFFVQRHVWMKDVFFWYGSRQKRA